MCGRFTQRSNLARLTADFQLSLPFVGELPSRRFNIAPTQQVAVVRAAGPAKARELAVLRWGLIPSWAKDPKIGNQTINARAESVAEKPAFRAAFKRRRCLVIADGFYEWQKLGKAKQPYFVHRQDDAPFAFAGLWESWRGSISGNAEPPLLETCTIITTTANDLMRPLHDRMPVILKGADFDLWLEASIATREQLESLFAPSPCQGFVATPVSTHVNSVQHDDLECLTAVWGARHLALTNFEWRVNRPA